MAQGTNLITAEGLRALEEELAALEGDGRRAIAERISIAREWGDLKENSEYHDAKNQQAHLETRIARLRERIANAELAEEGAAGEVVAFGKKVRVRDEDGHEHTWHIVSSHEASPTDGRVSVESPVAIALLGRAVGEHVTVSLPKRERSLTILHVD
jgi:transcription elongation factor GreA